MKILHAADLHQGLLTDSWPDPETGIPSRILDVAKCWQAACTVAAEREVDAVLVAGDAFHEANPDAVSLAMFRAGLRILEDAEIPALLLAGNHDRAPHANSLSVLHAFSVRDRIRVATVPSIYDVGGIHFACLPSVSRHQLMATNPTLSVQADQDLVDALVRIIATFRLGGADVLTGHWSVAGTVLGSETDIAITAEPTLPQMELEGPWRFAAFGHIHHAQTWQSGDTVGVYAGSIDRMNFGEEGDDKSVAILDLEEGTVERVPMPARRFVTLNANDPGNVPDVEDAIVRVRDVPPTIVPAMRELLRSKGAALVKIEALRERPTPVRSAEVAAAVGPLQALDPYMERRAIPEDRRPAVRVRASHIVRGDGAPSDAGELLELGKDPV